MAFPETTDNGLFEGLFVRALNVSGALAQDLKARGFDRAKIQPKYSSQVFFDCLEVARRHRFPDLPPQEGLKALGHTFFEGFRQTIVGSVATAALSFLGPRMMLPRVPGKLQSLRSDLKVSLEKRGPDDFALIARDPVQVGAFFAGALAEGLKAAGATGALVSSAPRPDGWVITVKLVP